MTASSSPEPTLSQRVIERYSRARVFDRYGLDYSCDGALTLADACDNAGVDPEAVRQSLAESDARLSLEDQVDWNAATISELVDNLITVHHEHLRRELPRLANLIDRVFVAHGAAHPEMADVKRVFGALRDELELHATKEETQVFPMCRQLEHAVTMPRFHCGAVRNPIRSLGIEHEECSGAFVTLRQLTGGFTAPEGVCNTYRAMLDGLNALEKELHRHIHKENNLLFPKAAALEAALNSGPPVVPSLVASGAG